MNASTLALIASLVAFAIVALVLVKALLPFAQHVASVLPR